VQRVIFVQPTKLARGVPTSNSRCRFWFLNRIWNWIYATFPINYMPLLYLCHCSLNKWRTCLLYKDFDFEIELGTDSVVILSWIRCQYVFICACVYNWAGNLHLVRNYPIWWPKWLKDAVVPVLLPRLGNSRQHYQKFPHYFIATAESYFWHSMIKSVGFVCFSYSPN
jgi:hypothetical protein